MLALAAGVLMAGGVGMMWRGCVVPTYTSAGQVQASLGVPVLGTLPASPCSTNWPHPFTVGRLMLLLSGMLLAGLCLGAAWAVWRGFLLG